MSYIQKIKLSNIVVIVGVCAIFLWTLSPAAMAQVVEPDEHDFMIAGPDELLPQDDTGWVYVYGHPSEPGLYVV